MSWELLQIAHNNPAYRCLVHLRESGDQSPLKRRCAKVVSRKNAIRWSGLHNHFAPSGSSAVVQADFVPNATTDKVDSKLNRLIVYGFFDRIFYAAHAEDRRINRMCTMNQHRCSLPRSRAFRRYEMDLTQGGESPRYLFFLISKNAINRWTYKYKLGK